MVQTRRKLNLARHSMVVVCAVCALAATVAGAEAGADPDSRPHGRGEVIRLIERVADPPVLDDRGEPGPGVGDRLIFSADLFDERDHRVGRDGADCVVVRVDHTEPTPTEQIVQCTVTVQLPAGQITFQGMAQGTDNRFAVTGGTGAYRRARGEAHVIDRVPLSEADVTITVVR